LQLWQVDFENATTKLDQARKLWDDVENVPRPLTPSRLLQAHQRLRVGLARVREMEQVNALYSRDEHVNILSSMTTF